ncbi:MAG: hypothetical protein RL398_470, partial [Planctomycetota bacterium]
SLAQTAACLAYNDTSTSVSNLIYSSSSQGPNRNAWQVSSASLLTVQAVQFYTSNNYLGAGREFMSVEVYDDNQGVPGNLLATGTWRIQAGTNWQGANLSSVLVMQPGTNYWIAFVEPGWSVVPVQPGGFNLPSYRQVGGVWQGATASAIKCRLFCGLLDDQGRVPFGGLCSGVGGNIGTVFANQPPTIGNSAFRFEGTGFAPASLAFLALGFVPSFPTFQIAGTNGCYQSTDGSLTVVGFTGSGNVRAASPDGHVQFNMPLPANPAFVGLYFSAQVAALDPGSVTAIPFVTSNAMQITLY